MARETKIASMWKAFVPTAQWLPEYRLGWLRPDLVAGITCNMRVRGEWQNRTAGLQSRGVPQLAAEPDLV
jgi:hypothetical protein